MKHWSQDLGAHGSLIDHLTKIPHCMLRNHEIDSLAQIILYMLSHADCFSFKRAAYFIDNPDFDCLKGGAGFQHEEVFVSPNLMCHSPQPYLERLSSSQYNKQVRDIARPSIKRQCDNINDSADFTTLCKDLGVTNAECVCWPLKHGNWGVLIFEHDSVLDPARRGLLDNAVSLLGFCPVS